jgi:hypothetical protein
MQSAKEPRFVVCISTRDYPASLEVRKIYRAVTEPNAAEHQMIRVIDESNEDYLYPLSYFVPVELPKAAEEAFSIAG